jgi:Tfp pilus assembly PilM family ATPase
MPTPTASTAALQPTAVEVDVLAALTAMQAQVEHLLATVQRQQADLDRLAHHRRR